MKGVAFASGPGGSARCTLRCESAGTTLLLLGPDSTYRFQGSSTALCPSGETIAIPDEFGTTRPGRHRRQLLKPSNADELLRALRECVGARVRVTRYREWVRPNGDRLEGRSVVQARARLRGVGVSVAVAGRFSAIPALDANGNPVATPAENEELPVCSADLVPRCSRE